MALPGKMPTRERLTELAGRIQHIFTHHGYTEEVGMTFSEMAALVKLAQDVAKAPPASDPVTGLTDPFAAEYEVVIPRGVKSIRIRVEKRGEAGETPRVVMEAPGGGAGPPSTMRGVRGEPIEVCVGRGGGAGSASPYQDRSVLSAQGIGEFYERTMITPAIPAEPDLWPEDPRAPKPPVDVPKPASDFEVGDWGASGRRR